jgi:hypothetical protein
LCFVEFHAPLEFGSLIRQSTSSLAIGELLSTSLYSGSSTRSCCFTVALCERFHGLPCLLVLLFATGVRCNRAKEKRFRRASMAGALLRTPIANSWLV